MKVVKITAYKSNDGSVWETEQEAIEQNFTDIIDKIDVDKDQVDGILEWIKTHSKDVKYILANINKISVG